MSPAINKLLMASFSALLIVLGNITISLDKAFAQVDIQSENNASSEKATPHAGVNVRGHFTSIPQFREQSSKPLPHNYYEHSFKAISGADMDHIRYVFFWESYETDPFSFMNEIKTVAETADRAGIKVIYDNHQFHTSSYLDPGRGTGFPGFFFKADQYEKGEGGSPKTDSARMWWSNWWNRSINDDNDIDGWTRQAEFLLKVVEVVDSHPSTIGYEILNEPQVHTSDQWEKIQKYNWLMAAVLRTETDKTIVFDRQIPSDPSSEALVTPENMAKMIPPTIDNSVFKSTIYGLPLQGSYAEDRLNSYAAAARLANVPLYMGEFNIGISESSPSADINQTQVYTFIDKFEEIDMWGWAYWIWNFKDHSIPNYNLVRFQSGNMQPTKYFDYLESAIARSKSNLENNPGQSAMADTIFPTVIIKTQPANALSNMSAAGGLFIEGNAIDMGSGIKSVEVLIDKGKYVAVTPADGDSWFRWYVILPESGLDTSAEKHKLTVRVTDNAGNRKWTSLYF